MKQLITAVLAAVILVSTTACQTSEGTDINEAEEVIAQLPESSDEGTGPESGEPQTESGTESEEIQAKDSSEQEYTQTTEEESLAESTADPPSETAEPSSESANSPEDNLPEPEDEELVKVIDYIPGIRQELAYATTDNFVSQRIYDFTDAYLRYGTVKKLAKVCEELAEQGIGLKIWDGFRPVAAQEALWNICPDPTYVSDPKTGTRSHCRGSAVDVTLVDLETGEELPVPTEFDDFTAYADRDYSDCSAVKAQNATLLEKTMEKHGFKPYSAEWWHFTDTDEYPVEEYFDPGMPILWEANCKQFIGMLKTTHSTGQFASIPKGGTFDLLDWEGKYAKVSYKGTVGYVMSSYIFPEPDTYLEDCLQIVEPTAVYSYNQMLSDIIALRGAYPDIVKANVIGTSELGRGIPALTIGDTDAEYHVLLHGAIHAREHMTTWLLMAMVDYWLQNDILSYGDICYHIIPMCNPDGVIISQTGTLTEEQKAIYKSDRKLGYTNNSMSTYASLWKSNGVGEDINRNFPSGWLNEHDRGVPSSMNYEGEEPFSAAEARILRDYTLQYEFDTTISYHATGSIIYYEYGKKQPVNRESKELGELVADITGYTMQYNEPEKAGAGYKDWAIDELGIPSLTIEVGCQSAPLAERELYSIFARNYRVLPTIARWLRQNNNN